MKSDSVLSVPLIRPKYIPGVLSGVIETMGKNVKSFKAGDEVYSEKSPKRPTTVLLNAGILLFN